jgi:hypothetical protein
VLAEHGEVILGYLVRSIGKWANKYQISVNLASTLVDENLQLSGSTGRPGDLTAAVVGQIGHMARTRSGNTGFDGRVWFFA